MKVKALTFIKEHGWALACYGALTLLPLLCCMAYCLKTGNSMWDIYLPASPWNDEIIYYKEVEGMLRYGMPRGYFGYSENHALVGSLSVWSPVLLLPWYVWGLLFGWGLLSPIWCNLTLMMLAMALFCALAKPDKRQCFWIAVFYACFQYFNRYILSALVEIPTYAFLIVALGLIYSLKKTFSWKKVTVLYVILAFLTLMRPYMILLSVIPWYYLARRKKKWLGIGGVLFFLQLISYFLMTHYFCSPYLDGQGLLGSAWLDVFVTEGIKSGLKNFIYIFLTSWEEYLGYMVSTHGENVSAMFAILFGVFCYQLYGAIQKKNREQALWNGFFVFYFVAMLLAAIYMFGIASGRKHMLCFVVLGLFVLAMDGLELSKSVGLSLALFYFFVVSVAGGGWAWNIPYIDMNIQAEIRKGEEVLHREIEVTDSDNPFDNTIVWTFGDVVDDQMVDTDWHMLYALPPGMGINMCLFDSLASDLSNVQSKYIFVVADGRTDQHCRKVGAKKLVEYGGMIIYQLRE